MTVRTTCPHGRTDGLRCYGHTDPARDCRPPCCAVHVNGRDGQPREDCAACMAALAYAARTGYAPPCGHRWTAVSTLDPADRHLVCPVCGATWKLVGWTEDGRPITQGEPAAAFTADLREREPEPLLDSYGGVHRLRTNSPEDGVRCGRIVPTVPPGVFAVEDAARVTCLDCRATLADSEQLPEDGPFSRPELLRVAREELAASEAHLTLARQIKADGNGAHSVPYWEREVARLRAKVADLEAPAGCPECGRTTPPITELGAKFCAGDFCSGPLPSPAGPAYWCKKCRKAVTGTIRADSEPPHFERHYLTSGPDRGMACGPVVRMCEQCGAAELSAFPGGAITVTDAGDFCSCGAEVQA